MGGAVRPLPVRRLLCGPLLAARSRTGSLGQFASSSEKRRHACLVALVQIGAWTWAGLLGRREAVWGPPNSPVDMALFSSLLRSQVRLGPQRNKSGGGLPPCGPALLAQRSSYKAWGSRLGSLRRACGEPEAAVPFSLQNMPPGSLGASEECQRDFLVSRCLSPPLWSPPAPKGARARLLARSLSLSPQELTSPAPASPSLPLPVALPSSPC